MLQNIRKAGIDSAYFAVASAAVAAGYWVASWFFGLTIPSATAATAQVVTFGVEGLVYGAFYEIWKNDKNYLLLYDRIGDFQIVETLYKFYKLKDDLKNIKNTYFNFIRSFKTAVFALKTTTNLIKLGIYSTAWAAPVGLAFLVLADLIIQVTSLVLSLNLYKNFLVNINQKIFIIYESNIR
ncbi:hypothetical protein MCAV_03760 [[Mycoplasma] cavipharyngis]|uniref:hypothetical protein n=1 Tax=[Mycoplasma] cavipharyngis TaxID=92757 RepID=UPI003704BD43